MVECTSSSVRQRITHDDGLPGCCSQALTVATRQPPAPAARRSPPPISVGAGLLSRKCLELHCLCCPGWLASRRDALLLRQWAEPPSGRPLDPSCGQADQRRRPVENEQRQQQKKKCGPAGPNCSLRRQAMELGVVGVSCLRRSQTKRKKD
jgi:hypothetical protein